MSTMIEAPRKLVESDADIRLPPRTDARLQLLMERNSNGQLQGDEREELESLVELSESMSLIRAEALRLLGRRP